MSAICFRYAEQKSEKISMKKGRFYYIAMYHKAEKLGDCASVAVEMPNGHFEGPIKQKHLRWKLQGCSLDFSFFLVYVLILLFLFRWYDRTWAFISTYR